MIRHPFVIRTKLQDAGVMAEPRADADPDVTPLSSSRWKFSFDTKC